MTTRTRSRLVWQFRSALVAALVVLSPQVSRGLDHSGTCSGTFDPAQNPHRLIGACVVPAGQTLTISPGVILVGQNYSLTVQAGGTLTAMGTSAAQRDVQLQNVYLTFNGPSGATPASTGTLTNCTITGPNYPISITDASPTIGSCTISGAYTAISVGGSSTVVPAKPNISGNTVSASSYGIQVSGTAQPTLTGNTITTNYVGLDYSGVAAGTATGNTIGLAPQSGSGRRAIQVSGGAAPVIDSNTITDDTTESDIGIAVTVNPGVAVQVTNNTIHASGGDQVLSLAPNVFAAGPTISGNLFPNGVAAGIGLSGTATSSVTLGPLQGQSTYTLVSTLSVASGATLTIAPGITVNGQGYTLQVQAGGTLTGVGTSAAQRDVQLQNVAVQFAAGSAGQLRNCTLNGLSYPISITDASPTISSCTISGAYTAISISGSSTVAPAQPSISGNTLSTSNYYGIQVSGTARPNISGNTIVTNYVGLSYSGTAAGTATGNTIGFTTQGGSGRTAIQVSGGAAPVVDSNTINDDPTESDVAITVTVNAGVSVRVTNNTIHASGGDRIFNLDPQVFAPGQMLSGNLFPDGAAGGIGLSGTVTSSITLGPLQGASTYTLVSTLYVASGATLTIPPGITVNGQGYTLQVQAGGALTAVGTSAAQRDVQLQNVSLTFNGPSGATPAGAGTLMNCTVTGSSYPISITDASPTISRCTISGTYTAISISGSSTVAPAQPSISGNTLSGSYYYGIQVGGTAQPSISGNTIVTNSVGLSYSGTAAGTATGNTIGFTTQGGSGRTSIQVSGGAAPVIDGNTIADDATESDIAITVTVNAGVSVRLTNNTIHASGGDRIFNFDPQVFAPGQMITGNLFPDGTAGGIGLSGTVTSSITLGTLQGASTYTLVSTLYVASGATLTIAPGITLNGQNNSLTVQAGGTLTAVGTSAAQRDVQLQNVSLTFNGPSGATAASAGTLMNCTVSGSYPISITDASPTISNCAISGTYTGISVTGSSTVTPAQPAITNTSISNTSYAIQISGTAQPSVTSCNITGASTGISLSGTTTSTIASTTFALNATAVSVSGAQALSTINQGVFDRNTFSLSLNGADALFSAFPAMFDTNTFTGSPDQNLIALPNSLTIASSGTIPAAKVAYQVGNLTINAGARVVVEPCTVFKNTSYSSFLVNGDLLAGGQPDCPIVFSAVTPKNGTRWYGLRWNNQSAASASFMDSCVVEFAGAGSQPALSLNNSSIDVSNSTVTANAAAGMQITNAASPHVTGGAVTLNAGDGVQTSSGAHPVFTQTSILQNGGYGMRNQDCPTVPTAISAQEVYWGDDSGPLDNSDDRASGGLYNPGGLGNAVSNCVNYDPWVRLGPSIAGTLAVVSGGGQSGVVGTLLPQPLVVQVTSTLGNPLANIDVTFSAAGGGIQIQTPQPVMTDANGMASATVRLGLTPGTGSIDVTARDVNSPLATFTAQGTASANLFALTTLDAVPNGNGDVNGDGSADNVDAAIIEAVLSGEAPADEGAAVDFSSAGDVNGDGTVDEGDALLVLNSLVTSDAPPSTSPGSLRSAIPAYVLRPRVMPQSGAVFRVPVTVLAGWGDVAAYAFAVDYDPAAVELMGVDGGSFGGFSDPPVMSVDASGGRVAFAAVNNGVMPAHQRLNVATLVFKALAASGTVTQIGLHPVGNSPLVLRPGFRGAQLRTRRPVRFIIR